MKRIVFFGSKKIGYECLNYLYLKQQDFSYEIVAILTNERGGEIREFCETTGIRVLENLDEYLGIDDVHIGISIQYHEILRVEHIQKASDIIVNLHMAPLPEYRGCNQFSFAISNNENEFGTTIHQLEEGIDSGPILFEKRFPVPEGCWVNELYTLTYQKSLELFRESLPALISGQFKAISQESLLAVRKMEYHARSEIIKLKYIDLNWDTEMIERRIRATSMPGFDPPYTVIGDKKVFFTID